MQETFPLLSERYEEITSAPLPKGQREHADNLMSSILTSMGPFYRLPDAIFLGFLRRSEIRNRTRLRWPFSLVICA